MNNKIRPDFFWKVCDIFAVVLFILVLVYLILFSYFHSIYFDGFPTDGPFQTFNSLRRLVSGQKPGIDFQVFHGIGIVYIQYPFYILFGKNLFASELSRWILSIFSYLFVYYIFFRTVRFRKIFSLLLSITLILLNSYLNFDTLLYPSISLLGLRSTAPILIGAMLLHISNKYPSTHQLFRWPRFELLCSFTLALSFFMGSEHGLYALLSILIIQLFFPLHQKPFLRRLASAGSILVFSIFLVIFIFLVIDGIYFYKPILYALSSVPSDQFWYFGVPPNLFVSNIFDLIFDMSIFPLLLFNIILLYILIKLFHKKIDYTSTTNISIFIYLIIYGFLTLVSLLGIAAVRYLEPIVRIDIIIFTVLLLQYLPIFISRKIHPNIIGQKKIISFFEKLCKVILCCILTPFLIFNSLDLYYFQHTLHDSSSHTKKVQGVYLSPKWTFYYDKIQSYLPNTYQFQNEDIWSTYAGLIEAEKNTFHPSTDYIIHALGSEARKKYIDDFIKIKPQYVITMNKGWFVYEEWLQNSTWQFYEPLLYNYTPYKAGFALLWKKNVSDTWLHSSKSWQNIDDFPPHNAPIQLPIQSEDIPKSLKNEYIVIIKLTYNIHNPWKKVPIIGGTPRYFVNFSGTCSAKLPISLPPYYKEFTFPIIVKKEETPSINIEILPHLPYVDFELKDVQYRILDAPDENIQTLFRIQ